MNPGAGAMGDMWPPTGVQQVCLVLSPRAAEAVADALTEQRANLAPEWISGDEDVIATCNLIEEVRDEIQSQQRNLPASAPTGADAIAKTMAEAGAKAVKAAT
jgi:hypothetical protein